jgi:hypothetical protein
VAAERQMPTLEHFTRHVEFTDGCWIWHGDLDRSGYERIQTGTRPRRRWIRAHRAAWMLFYGPIPEGMDVCHCCDNPSCVHPGQLFLGTHADNMTDMVEKGRSLRGERHPNAKLTEADIKAIRTQYAAGGVTGRELGERYGVATNVIYEIAKRRKWRHVP